MEQFLYEFVPQVFDGATDVTAVPKGYERMALEPGEDLGGFVKVRRPFTQEEKQFYIEEESRQALREELGRLTDWFGTFYDVQINQALRAQRLDQPWSADDGEKAYSSVQALDTAAKDKQERIRTIRAQLQTFVKSKP